MEQLPPGCVDLVFADPPFNIGYDYDVYADALHPNQYLNWCQRWMAGVHRALKDDGTFWLAIGDEYAAELKVLAQREIGFRCRSWVVWYYTFGVNCRQKFTRSHAHLFYFVKNEKQFTFRGEELENRIPSARQLVYADKRANPQGRLPDDTWIISPADVAEPPPSDRPPAASTWVLRPQDLADRFTAQEDTWYFPRVAGTFKEREGFHGCQMPEQLLGRIIRMCSHPGEMVLDPFSGSATTLAVAKKLGRRYLGFDLSEQYVTRGLKRLESIAVGDPLDGSPEPTMSAPTTKAGRRVDETPSSPKVRSRKRTVSTKSQPLPGLNHEE
ncbi:site-specific DNA-methyltransferase [bacterium]|nr:site-specific DNA-methyltransferase [bacterium]